MTALLRFYTRWSDGTIEGDETVIIDRKDLASIEKGISILGEHGHIVVEFDPPLIVPQQDSSPGETK